MYRLQIYTEQEDDFGLRNRPVEYVLRSTDDVCKVIEALSGSKCFISLQELKISSVDDVRKDFKLI